MLPLSLEFGERLRCRRNKERERSFAGAAGKCGKPHGFSGREMLPGGSDGRIGDKWGKSGEAGAEAAGRLGPCGGPGPGRGERREGALTEGPDMAVKPGNVPENPCGEGEGAKRSQQKKGGSIIRRCSRPAACQQAAAGIRGQRGTRVKDRARGPALQRSQTNIRRLEKGGRRALLSVFRPTGERIPPPQPQRGPPAGDGKGCSGRRNTPSGRKGTAPAGAGHAPGSRYLPSVLPDLPRRGAVRRKLSSRRALSLSSGTLPSRAAVIQLSLFM